MADIKPRSAVEQFMGRSGPRHEPEVEDSQVREAYEDIRKTRLRGRESVTLDIRFADGRCSGFNYAYLVRADYVPGDHLHLHFAEAEIHIEGRRLKDLYLRLLDHRVEAVQEGTETEDGLKSEETAHIDLIKIRNKEEHVA